MVYLFLRPEIERQLLLLSIISSILILICPLFIYINAPSEPTLLAPSFALGISLLLSSIAMYRIKNRAKGEEKTSKLINSTRLYLGLLISISLFIIGLFLWLIFESTAVLAGSLTITVLAMIGFIYFMRQYCDSRKFKISDEIRLKAKRIVEVLEICSIIVFLSVIIPSFMHNSISAKVAIASILSRFTTFQAFYVIDRHLL